MPFRAGIIIYGKMQIWQVKDMSSFKDVVGHKNIIKYIQNAVAADAVSHAMESADQGKSCLPICLP